MNLGRDLARLALGILLVTFAVGLLVGSCDGRVARRDLARLQDDSASLASTAESRAAFSRIDSLARVRAEARADSLQAVADGVTVAQRAVRARVVVRERVVYDTTGAKAADSLVADALLAADQRHAADSAAIVGHLIARDSLSRELLSVREENTAVRAQLANAHALRVAVEKVNRPSLWRRATCRVAVGPGYGATAARDGTFTHGATLAVSYNLLGSC